ncbi:MAG: 1-(5-phosphoribosyl)-5-[(5-phosphoribosylamino)methylideneamino]imidazole-4-carboxamide isomerase [Verrucomicrobia bacterium]|nr:1-(5-phosphoribosyl)-5-[(5-phosphoribosylamino)methylideneamino]imidazole-4-carboxamide isomerase [Verrucomicrobiota bacterium]
MIIYPAIDIRNGRCVRLLQGKAEQETVYYDRPVDAAKVWIEAGTKWMHMVDLDGAFTGTSSNLKHVAEVAALGLKVQLGGGLRDFGSVKAAFDAGVSRAVIGTRACSDPRFVQALIQLYGDKIAVGIDAKDGLVAVKGWVDTSDVTALDLAKQVSDFGVRTIIYTDISTDGMMAGPNLEAQEEMLSHCSANIIASGGVSRMEDLASLADLGSRHENLDGVITGKAIYEGAIDLSEALEQFPQE